MILMNLLLIDAVAFPDSSMMTAAAAILVSIRPSRVKLLFTSHQIIFQKMVAETSQPHPFFSIIILTLSKAEEEPWGKHQCPICTMLSWWRSIYFWPWVISEWTESHGWLRQAQNSTQSMAREWRGRDIVIYWCGPLRILLGRSKRRRMAMLRLVKWKWKDALNFWIELDLDYRQQLAVLAFFIWGIWLLAIKVQTDSGSKSVQINQYNILWVLRSQSILHRS